MEGALQKGVKGRGAFREKAQLKWGARPRVGVLAGRGQRVAIWESRRGGGAAGAARPASSEAAGRESPLRPRLAVQPREPAGGSRAFGPPFGKARGGCGSQERPSPRPHRAVSGPDRARASNSRGRWACGVRSCNAASAPRPLFSLHPVFF